MVTGTSAKVHTIEPGLAGLTGKFMSIVLEGGCLCGATRYRIDPFILNAGICHCETCRRAAGAQSVAWVTVPASGFRFDTGRPAIFASSPGVERTHCPTCGTSLTYRSEADTIDVTIGSLDDPEAVPPTQEIWLEHRLTWEAIDPSRSAWQRSSG